MWAFRNAETKPLGVLAERRRYGGESAVLTKRSQIVQATEGVLPDRFCRTSETEDQNRENEPIAGPDRDVTLKERNAGRITAARGPRSFDALCRLPNEPKLSRDLLDFP